MRKLLTILLLISTLFVNGQGGQTVVQIDAIPGHTNYNKRQCILKLPNDYGSTGTQRYPLMIYLHGSGQTSTDPSWAYFSRQNGGPAYYIASGNPTAMSQFVNPKDNQTYKYIFLTPMGPPSNYPEWNTNGQDLSVMIKYMIDNYRADSTRIYLTGWSQGGAGATYYVTHNGVNPRYKIAAYVPVEHATSSATTQGAANTIVADSTRAWGFGDAFCGPPSEPCDIHGIKTKEMMDRMNTAKSGMARFTLSGQGLNMGLGNHGSGCFKAYDPSYRETINGRSMNMYEWCLQFKQGSGNAPPTPTNQSPIANAGANQAITQPTTSVTLNGSSSYDPDGSITTYAWTKTSGPSCTITSSTLASTTVTGMNTVGTYVFQLTVQDNFNPKASAVASTQVTISAVGSGGTRIYINQDGGGQRGVYWNALTRTPAIAPGDTIVIRSSLNPWSYITFVNLQGTAAKPIVIINEGGQVISTSVAQAIGGLKLSSSTNVKWLGTGASGVTYGFYCTADTTQNNINNLTQRGVGFTTDGKSSDIEWSNIDVYNKTYVAFCKEEATCDSSLQYPNWRMNNIKIHDIKGKNIRQDGMYIGSTGPYGTRPISCQRYNPDSGKVVTMTTYPIPMRLSNVHIWNVILDSLNRTGIQLSGADSGYNEINNCTITRAGFEWNQQQGTGISIGGGAYADVHDNIIRQTFINGIFVLGTGLNKIYNNYVDSSGFLGSVKNDISICQLPSGGPCSVPFPILVRARPATPPDSLGFWVYNNRVGRGLTTDSVQIVIQGDYANLYKKTGNKVCGNTKIWNGAAAGVNVNTGISYTVPSPCPGTVGNICPSVYAGADQTVTINSGSTGSTGVSGSATDQDGTISTYAWTKFSGPSGGTISAPSSATTSITGLVQGTYVFRVTATDNSGCAIYDAIQVTVNLAVANQLPTSEAGVSQSITLPTNSTALNGSGQDADGTIVSYLWTKLASSPASGSITTTGSASTMVINLVQGTYQFQLRVTDNSGGTGTDVVTVVVNPAAPPANQPPTATISNSDIDIQLPINFVTLIGVGSDADGTISTYAWTKIAGGAATIASASNDTTDITGMVAGTYQFQLTVTDNLGATGSATISVTVQPSNQKPIVTTPSDTTLSYQPTSSRTLIGSATDPDGTISSYAWSQIEGPITATIVSPTAATTSITGMTTLGVYIFRLSATDNLGGLGSNDVVIEVVANIEPVASAGGSYVITLPTTSVTLSGSGIDIDGTISTYGWVKTSGPSGGDIASPASASTAINNLIEGNYEYTLTVTDNAGATHSSVATIRVTKASLFRLGTRYRFL